MNSKLLAAGLFACFSIVGAGCDLGPVGTPPPLSKRDVKKVLGCQEAIKDEGRDFTKIKLRGVEKCLDKVLELQMEYENGLISENEFNKKLERVRKDCLKEYARIQKASKELVDEVLDECGPVEAIVFSDYDPLKFTALSSFNGTFFEPSVDNLAGFICGVKEVVVDLSVFLQVPRMYELFEILDNGGEGFSVELGGIRIPNPELMLDPRCFVFDNQT